VTNDIERLKATYAHLLTTRCFDFSPPQGWLGIVESLLVGIGQVLQDTEVPAGIFTIRQVKEKFGALRVYVAGLPMPPSNPNLPSEWASEAEDDSSLVPQSRDWHFDGICSIAFQEHIEDSSIVRILTAIEESAYVPEAVATQIRCRIEAARQEADRTCQLCGAAGAMVIDNGWHMTVCEEHRDAIARAAWWTEREQRR
jgi:hypothetical protein